MTLLEKFFASGVPGTMSRNSLHVDIWFKRRSSHGQKLVPSFKRNLHIDVVFGFEYGLGSRVLGTVSRNSLFVEILFKNGSSFVQKFLLSFKRNLYIWNWFCTNEAKENYSCRVRGGGDLQSKPNKGMETMDWTMRYSEFFELKAQIRGRSLSIALLS